MNNTILIEFHGREQTRQDIDERRRCMQRLYCKQCRRGEARGSTKHSSLNHSINHSGIHSLCHSPILSLSHSITHSFYHSLILSFNPARAKPRSGRHSIIQSFNKNPPISQQIGEYAPRNSSQISENQRGI